MGKQSRADLGLQFENGDIPNETSFDNVFDSFPNFVDDGVPRWRNVIIPYTSWQPSAASNSTVGVFTLPATGFIHGLQLIIRSKFLGGAITAATMELKYGSSPPISFFTTDVFRVSNGINGASMSGIVNNAMAFSRSSNIALEAKLTVTGGVINDLTQGEVRVWYYSSDAVPV